MLHERGAGVEAERDLAVGVGASVGDVLVLAGDDGDEVGGQRVIHLRRPGVALAGGGLVEHHGVVLRGGDVDVVGGLDIRLVKAGEDLHRHRGFELGVEVVLVIDRVGELVQALTSAVVGDRGVDDDGVRALAQVELRALDRRAVERGGKGVSHQVEEGLARGGIEGDRGLRAELLGPGDVEVDVVVDVGNQADAVARVGASEISFHGPNILAAQESLLWGQLL